MFVDMLKFLIMSFGMYSTFLFSLIILVFWHPRYRKTLCRSKQPTFHFFLWALTIWGWVLLFLAWTWVLSLFVPSFPLVGCFVGLAYQGKDIIVFRFIIEYSSIRDFYRPLGNNNNNNRSNFILRIFERRYFGWCWNLRLVIIEL
jgi:hypothetical protein